MLLQNNIRLLEVILNENRHTSIKPFNYDTQIYKKFNAKSIKTYLVGPCKRGLIVSLRAPKHFKVGRQQFNTWNQRIRTTFHISSTPHSMEPRNIPKFIQLTNKSIIRALPHTALSSITSIKVKYEVSETFTIF